MNVSNSNLRPAARALWVLLPVALISMYFVRQTIMGPVGTDASMFLTGAHILTSGQGTDLYSITLETKVQAGIDPLATSFFGLLPFNYPPYVAIFLAPFAVLPIEKFYYFWVAAQYGVLIGLVVWVASYFRRQYRVVPKPIILAMFSFAPVFEVFLWGQMSLVLLSLWWWAFVSWRQEKWGQLGVAVAFSAFKPQLAVLLLVGLVAQKRWRALGYAVATQALLWGAAVLLAGPRIVQSYLGMLQVSSSTFGTFGFFENRMMSLRGLLSIVDVAPQVSVQIALAFWVASIGVAFWVWLRPWSLAARFGVTAVLAVLFSPHLYIHDASLLLLAIICISLAQLEHRRLPNYNWLLASLAAVFLVLYLCLITRNSLSVSWYPIILTMWAFCLLLLTKLVSAERPIVTRAVQNASLTRAMESRE
jgi:hypothetical protein